MRRSSSLARPMLLAPGGLLLLVLLLAPMMVLLSYSFAPGGSMRPDFSAGLTFENYISVLGDPFYLAVIGRTMLISLIVTAASLLLGWPLAYFLWRAPARWRTLLTLAVVAPLLISIPVRNYGWMVLLGDQGLINGLLVGASLVEQPLRLMYTNFATVIGLTHVLMPFVVLSVVAALERVPPELLSAAETLGASRLRAILEIALPLSLPGAIGGAALVFCVAVSAYVTPALMGPSGANYATTLIYQQFISTLNWPRGATIAVVLLIITAATLIGLLGFINKRFSRALRGS